MAKTKFEKGKAKSVSTRLDKSKNVSSASKTEKGFSSKTSQVDSNDFAFGRINYLIMLGGLFLIIVGYALMAGGKSSTPEEFNPEIFSFQRITVAPLLVLAGLVVQVWAIVKKAD